jgi:hypothetical protein
MAATRVLLDTGPLVAYLNRADSHHDWAVECWRALTDAFWTCEAVLSEATFLLQSNGATAEPVLRLLERGLVRLNFAVADHRAVRRAPAAQVPGPADESGGCVSGPHGRSRGPLPGVHDRPRFQGLSAKGRHRIPLLAPFEH